ncbi:uncharacterized protein Z518_09575 [Rhinocladiella mackenziei CBS 650.93]|uniref:Alpha-1,3-mannosyltransferase CMT1 n=1 Tax=Rhinocladiella mackenziei CBS 650.93 TaxID=1442369 RepID=A0A0D2GU40_9EURO|nr:uncharacterized protein Z518_09575 [Rhinocladiella mackenziei CBS 650.93]KIX01848.1 hypothetical protein Z518_09575 [Rhinocladiella mackenziei CBS 650.93]
MRRRVIISVQFAALFAVFLFFGFYKYQSNPRDVTGYFSSEPVSDWPNSESGSSRMSFDQNTAGGAAGDASNDANDDADYSEPNSPPNTGNATQPEVAQSYVDSILDDEDGSIDRLKCPVPQWERYKYLRRDSAETTGTSHYRKYYFALDLYQCAPLLPRLMGSVVEAIRFLGPFDCAVSVVEGRSDDGTWEILSLLRPQLEALGVAVYLTKNDVDPMGEGVYRIDALAELRNAALAPLQLFRDQFSREETTVIFINDVAICTEDILELIRQRLYQNADMVCAMDWTYVGPEPTFYDVWIARGMTGDLFFNIPPDGSWDLAWDLFWNDPTSRAAQQSGRPFQVYSCWNGATAFTAKPIMDCQIKFRVQFEDECPQGEPKSLCKDMWAKGYGKIAVIPSVNLEYSNEAGKRIKNSKGYVSRWLQQGGSDDKIDWQISPPAEVKCMPTHENQFFEPWDAQLAENEHYPNCIILS